MFRRAIRLGAWGNWCKRVWPHIRGLVRLYPEWSGHFPGFERRKAGLDQARSLCTPVGNDDLPEYPCNSLSRRCVWLALGLAAQTSHRLCIGSIEFPDLKALDIQMKRLGPVRAGHTSGIPPISDQLRHILLHEGEQMPLSNRYRDHLSVS